MYRERHLLNSAVQTAEKLVRALRKHKKEAVVTKCIEELNRKRRYVEEHRARERKRLEKIKLKKEREELKRKIKEDQLKAKQELAAKRLQEKKERDELKKRLKREKAEQKEAARLAREEKKQKEKEMKELEREKKKKEKLVKKRMGSAAITSFFSKSPTSSSKDAAATTTENDVEKTSTSSKKRRNLFASFAPVAKRIGTKVPKGYMFFMSHEIPYNAETARPARLRKKRSGRDKTTIVNGRRPLALDPSKNYDMDSDEEWAEQGESLSGDSDIEETTHEENDYEMDDWLCSDEDVEYVGAENNDTGNGDVVDESKTSSTGVQEIRPRKWKPKTKSGMYSG